METLTLEEITQAIHDYIKENYYYDSADVFEDEISYKLDNKIFTICVSLESESE